MSLDADVWGYEASMGVDVWGYEASMGVDVWAYEVCTEHALKYSTYCLFQSKKGGTADPASFEG